MSLAFFTPTRSFFRAWLCCISSSCLLYVFRMKMHKIPFPSGDKGTCHTTQLEVSEPVKLDLGPGPVPVRLELPSHGHGRTLTAERADPPGPLEHKVYACKCASVWCSGSLGSFLLPGNAALAERNLAACPAWCALAEAWIPAGESVCFPTGRALFFPDVSPEVQLGPKQTLSGRVKNTAEAKQRI